MIRILRILVTAFYMIIRIAVWGALSQLIIHVFSRPFFSSDSLTWRLPKVNRECIDAFAPCRSNELQRNTEMRTVLNMGLEESGENQRKSEK